MPRDKDEIVNERQMFSTGEPVRTYHKGLVNLNAHI